jgi:DNA-binding winged helix-turn-helix (wHTH) protein
MIRFDPLNHTVFIGEKTCKLQPLSYRLLEVLADHRNEIIPGDLLMKLVWEGVVVSPDTVKQRVFLLREALSKSGFDQQMLQSIRGQGYRLVINEVPSQTTRTTALTAAIPHWRWAALALIVTLGLIAWYQLVGRPGLPANNRVVFWYQADPSAQQWLYSDARQQWITKLSNLDGVNYVAASQQVETANERPGLKARKFRAALVSYWTLYDRDGEPWVRMQLLEPKTETVLLNLDVDTASDQDVLEAMDRQAIALHRILTANILPLDSESLNNTDHDDWQMLQLLSLSTMDLGRASREQANLPEPVNSAFALIRGFEELAPCSNNPSLTGDIQALYKAYPGHFDVQRALLWWHDADGSCADAKDIAVNLSEKYPLAFDGIAACKP